MFLQNVSRKEILGPAAAFLLMLLVYPLVARFSAYFSTEPWCFFDDGTIAYTAYRVSLGELPHIAFPYHYSGGFEIILGGFFRVFRPTFTVAQFVLGLCMASTAAVIYYIHRALQIDRYIAGPSSLLVVGISFISNFHLFAAWPAQALVFVACIFFMNGLEKNSAVSIIVAGMCLGVASSMKQTIGLYAIFGFMIYALVHAATEPTDPYHGTNTDWTKPLFVELLLVIIFSFLPIAFFLFVLRSQIDAVNFLMFLLVPFSFTATGVWMFVRRSARSPEVCHRTVRSYERTVMRLVFGMILGFLPIVLLYLWVGGLKNFIFESFLQVQQVVSKRSAGFEFSVSKEELAPAIRRLLGFSLPLVSSLASFGIGYGWRRRGGIDQTSRWFILNGILLSVMYFTLYPNVNRAYVFFLLPLIVMPFISILDGGLQQRMKTRIGRVVITGLLLVFVLGGYILSKQMSNDGEKRLAGSITKIDEQRGAIYLPSQIAESVQPVVKYLRTRSATEKFLGYDVYNKAIAFLVGRPIEVDYQQRHHYGEMEDQDIYDIIALADERGIDTIILGKPSLRHTEAEAKMFLYLSRKYKLVLDTPSYFAYQRLTG